MVPWTAPVAGRARAASGHLVSAGCRRARQLRVFTGREPVATCPSRSPGERARRTQAMSLRERNSHGSHASKISQKKQNAGHDHRARRGRQQDRAGQAQEGPDERLDGPVRLRGEDSGGFLRLFGDRGLRRQLRLWLRPTRRRHPMLGQRFLWSTVPAQGQLQPDQHRRLPRLRGRHDRRHRLLGEQRERRDGGPLRQVQQGREDHDQAARARLVQCEYAPARP